MIRTVFFLVMEMTWIAMLALLVDGLIGGPQGPWVAGVVLAYPVGLIVNIRLAALRHPRIAIGLSAAGFIATATAAVMLAVPEFALPTAIAAPVLGHWILEDTGTHRMIAVVSIALFSWMRGTMLAGREVDGLAAALGFQIGLAALLSIHGLAALTGQALPGGIVAAGVFVCSGLLTLWHVRAGSSRGQRRDPGAAILGLVMVLVLGGLITALASPPVLNAALDALRALWSLLIAAVVWFFSLFPDPDPTPMDLPAPAAGPAMGEAPPERPLFQPMEWMRIVFGILFFGGFAVLVAVMLLLNLRDLLVWLRGRIRRTPGLAFDRSPRRLSDTMRAILHALGEAFALWVARWRRALTPAWAGGEAVATEQRLYRRMASQMVARGWPRRRGETPHEYARRMQARWPGTGGDLTVLTGRFTASRYGGRDGDDTRLRRLWKKIRRSLSKVPFANDQSGPSSSGSDTGGAK